ncbi:MAG: hypothetical protein HOP19_05500 [Acidobacteria bacterium]|nr:hypothetical protein [Acidobacteriota bacterium]
MANHWTAKADEISATVSRSRREFLRSLTGAACARPFMSVSAPPFAHGVQSTARRAVVVTFGGGCRDEEVLTPQGQQNVPYLLRELIPQGTFFTHVENRGILGHYVATASLTTGVYETFDNFAAVPPQSPTVFEYFRKGLKRPLHDAWVVAPSNGFNRIGSSDVRSFGPDYGAQVVLPKRFLKQALAVKATGTTGDYARMLQDNYETPLFSPQVAESKISLDEFAELLNLSVKDFVTQSLTLSSADELSLYVAKRLMRRYAPHLLWITLHDMDVAHAGCYSLYLEGIQRTDRLCREIWRTIQTEPEYAGKTALFILPDFGRDSDDSIGGNGFQHHRTGDALSRTTWMLALGPGIHANRVVDRPVAPLDVVPTLGAMLGFDAKMARGKPLNELL